MQLAARTRSLMAPRLDARGPRYHVAWLKICEKPAGSVTVRVAVDNAAVPASGGDVTAWVSSVSFATVTVIGVPGGMFCPSSWIATACAVLRVTSPGLKAPLGCASTACPPTLTTQSWGWGLVESRIGAGRKVVARVTPSAKPVKVFWSASIRIRPGAPRLLLPLKASRCLFRKSCASIF
jgi:hypothetical protein